jgi:hypothetical protein
MPGQAPTIQAVFSVLGIPLPPQGLERRAQVDAAERQIVVLVVEMSLAALALLSVSRPARVWLSLAI